MVQQIVTYGPPLLGFVAALTALLGPSRRPDGTGFAALTPFGWAAGGIAVLGLALGLASVARQNAALERAEAELAIMQRAAIRDLQRGVVLANDVLLFAALMPYTTGQGSTGTLPFARDEVDLRSERTREDLRGLVLHPSARLGGPWIPAAVPFGTDARPAMRLLVEETWRAVEILRSGLQIYAARAIEAEVLQAASELSTDAFLHRLTRLEEEWASRSRIQDTENPEFVNLRFLDSGVAGASTEDYLTLLDRLERLRAALAMRDP
jgi:hypothetical protein